MSYPVIPVKLAFEADLLRLRDGTVEEFIVCSPATRATSRKETGATLARVALIIRNDPEMDVPNFNFDSSSSSTMFQNRTMGYRLVSTLAEHRK